MLSKSLDELESRRILIVDDNAFMRKAIKKMLDNLGFEFLFDAENGADALEYLRRNAVDLLITDIQMPEMNGLELIQHVRCGEGHIPRGLPVLIVTSFSDDDTLRTALALDVNGLLPKPFKPLSVIAKIIQAFSEDELSLQSTEHYATALDESALASSPGNAQNTLPGEGLSDQPDQKRTGVFELQPGMTLTEDVLHKNGSLLLRKGSVLTTRVINRLQELRTSLQLTDIGVENPEDD